jgi:hypothetical protein
MRAELSTVTRDVEEQAVEVVPNLRHRGYEVFPRQDVDRDERSRERRFCTRRANGDAVNKTRATREDRRSADRTANRVVRLDSERCPVRRHWMPSAT